MTIGKLIAATGFVLAMAAPTVAPIAWASAQEATGPQIAALTPGLTIVLEHVPADTPKGASIYIGGTFNDWEANLPEYRLTPDGHGRYTITLPGNVRGPIQFKFTLGWWKSAEVDAAGARVPNRSFTVPDTGSATYTASVLAWPTPHTPEGWRKAATKDLAAVHDLLRDNAPQMFVDRDSADFRKWLETGYAEAQRRLPKVQDYNGYIYLLWGYAGGFRDGHLRVSGSPEHHRWPGFAMAWANGSYVVRMQSASAKDRLPPIGAKLLDCDGKSAENIARSHIDRYDGNIDLYNGRAQSAFLLLWDLANPFVEPLKTCRFQGPSGVEEYPLSYRHIDRNELKFPQSPRARFGLTQAAPKVWRIGIPAMSGALAWPSLYADINAHLNDIRSSDRIIIDLRGNGGGSGVYAWELAKRLWGEPIVDHYQPFLGPVVYPVTPGLRQTIAETTIPELRKQSLAGKIPQQAVTEEEALLAQLDKAMAEGRKFITEGRETAPVRGTPPANPMKAQVFLVTDHACFSACLDLMDLFLALPNDYHAGTETGADTIFMEAETHQLPSGQEYLNYGHKAWTKRPRGSNVPYTPAPALTYSGDLADEAAFERWLAAIPAQQSR